MTQTQFVDPLKMSADSGDGQTEYGCAQFTKDTLHLSVTPAAAKIQAAPFSFSFCLTAISDRENFTAKGLSAGALRRATNNPNKTLMKEKENLERPPRGVLPLITAIPVVHRWCTIAVKEGLHAR